MTQGIATGIHRDLQSQISVNVSFVTSRIQYVFCSKFLLWVLGLKLMGLGRCQVILNYLNARLSDGEMAPTRFGTLVLFIFLSPYLHAVTHPE